MNTDKFVKFSECDDDIPNGEWTGLDAKTAEQLFAIRKKNQFIAFDDTGESEMTGQGPYYLYTEN